jgi:hypothetical protein
VVHEASAMTFWSRFGGAIALVLAATGFVGCVVGSVAMWVFCHHLSGKVGRITAGLENGLQRVAAANQNVRRAVQRARTDVARVRQESAELGDGGVKSARAARAVRTLIQQHVGPDVEELGGQLVTLADTAAAASSVLQSFQELPLSRAGRIKSDQLDGWADDVQQLSATLRRLEGVVGDGDKGTSGPELAAATGAVDLALERWQGKLDDWQALVDAVGGDVQRVKAEAPGWLTLAAIGVTIFLAWMALGQLSLLAHGLQWCRRA